MTLLVQDTDSEGDDDHDDNDDDDKPGDAIEIAISRKRKRDDLNGSGAAVVSSGDNTDSAVHKTGGTTLRPIQGRPPRYPEAKSAVDSIIKDYYATRDVAKVRFSGESKEKALKKAKELIPGCSNWKARRYVSRQKSEAKIRANEEVYESRKKMRNLSQRYFVPLM